MKKFILYFLTLVWCIIGIFTLNLTTVNAAGFPTQKSADGTNLPWQNKTGGDESFIESLQRWVGWLMTVLAVITMFILVYGGILMITAAGDEEKYKKGFTILKQAAVWLIFLGLAWLFIMLVFYVLEQMVTGAEA